MKYSKRNWAAWAVAAGIRAAKTFGQSAAAVLVSSAVVQDVDWALVLGSAALAALISLATSLAGLPELPDKDGDGIPDCVESESAQTADGITAKVSKR